MGSLDRDSFVFYRSFYEALQNVPKKYRTDVYEACFTYVFESREPSLSGVPRALWELIRPQLDASQKRYENAKKGAEYGKLGGRPKKKEENKKPLKGYESETLNVNVNVNENVNDNENVNVNASVPDDEHTTHTDTDSETTGRPSNLDVLGEIVSKGYRMTGESIKAFMDYNDARGWKMDWRLALKKWNDKEKPPDKPKKSPAGKFANFPQRTDPENYENMMKVINGQIGG